MIKVNASDCVVKLVERLEVVRGHIVPFDESRSLEDYKCAAVEWDKAIIEYGFSNYEDIIMNEFPRGLEFVESVKMLNDAFRSEDRDYIGAMCHLVEVIGKTLKEPYGCLE